MSEAPSARARAGSGTTSGSGRVSDRDAALQRVFDAEWGPMVRLATLLLSGDQRRAEEVVQDALLGLHRAWSGLDDRTRDAGYLRRSVVNGCRSVHRHQAVEQRNLRVLAHDDVSDRDTARETADHDQVVRILRALPVRQREVLVLRFWGDATEAEIARTLGISTGAVKTHAHRGLSVVRARLAETEVDRGRG